MRLPEELEAAIARETEARDGKALARAAQEITAAYREGNVTIPALRSDTHRVAYLNVRLPATYAACAQVFSAMRPGAADAPVRSLLDLGAGPGTALWAASEVFPELEDAVLVERDEALTAIGERMTRTSQREVLRRSRWQIADVERFVPDREYDCVSLSFALGELEAEAGAGVIERAWRASRRFLVIIEPGTPRGFRHVLNARRQLIAAGTHVAAPCPHERECPMAATGDWCHFSVRVERTSLHRRLKLDSLGYEDEKFSYAVFARDSTSGGFARVVRHPQIRSGHVRLQLCTPDGIIEQRTVAKSQKDIYRAARKAEWGDRFPG